MFLILKSVLNFLHKFTPKSHDCGRGLVVTDGSNMHNNNFLQFNLIRLSVSPVHNIHTNTCTNTPIKIRDYVKKRIIPWQKLIISSVKTTVHSNYHSKFYIKVVQIATGLQLQLCRYFLNVFPDFAKANDFDIMYKKTNYFFMTI